KNVSENRVLVCVGVPGSGKSTFPKKWYRVNQDDLGTRRACEDLFKECNFNGNQRQVWINLAWSFGVPVDAIIMDTPMEVKGQKGLEILADFQKWMILPSYEEGFERIISIKSQPTSDSYNDKVIEEILTKLTEEPI
ncbi:8101_t:CDS:2, partial [Gigaspora margarita]